MIPVQIAFTRTWREAYTFAKARVSERTAACEALYTATAGLREVFPATDETLTTAPPDGISGQKCCSRKNTGFALAPTIRSQYSPLTSSSGQATLLPPAVTR
jgi:hypothetical protein